jgi:hypothetical protein
MHTKSKIGQSFSNQPIQEIGKGQELNLYLLKRWPQALDQMFNPLRFKFA